MQTQPPWQTVPAAITLLPGDIHVWRAGLDVDPAALNLFRQTLAPDELARAERFVSPIHRDRYVAGRGILRALLARYLCGLPNQFSFRLNEYGKPALATGSVSVDLRFNLSHSQGMALYAFTLGREVGVDVEFIRPLGRDLRLAERFFSPQEVKGLRALSPSALAEAFFHCWTRKEAYIKARGAGLSIGLSSFSVSLAADTLTHLPIIGHDGPEAGRWWLRALSPDEGYVGAVSAEGADWGLKLWLWK